MRRYKAAFDIFFRVEDRVRKEEIEEHIIKEEKQEWRCAADAARIFDENATLVHFSKTQKSREERKIDIIHKLRTESKKEMLWTGMMMMSGGSNGRRLAQLKKSWSKRKQKKMSCSARLRKG